MSKDRIYEQQEAAAGSFEFNAAVADVFPDMLRRSIPGYDASITAIGQLAARYVRPGTHCYDLGCSLGAATLAMRRSITAADCPNFRIVAVDAAPAMTKRCRELLADDDRTTECVVQEADIRQGQSENAAMVVMNYTLQFLPVNERLSMIRRIYEGMNDGGVFVLSEKVADDDPEVEGLLVDLHHEFKKANAYSDLEISRKRTALERVLIPETTDTHLQRLADAGFGHCGVWLRHFNFVSIVALR
jgi:tRNA (cmo5U34)-methyltransferase